VFEPVTCSILGLAQSDLADSLALVLVCSGSKFSAFHETPCANKCCLLRLTFRNLVLTCIRQHFKWCHEGISITIKLLRMNAQLRKHVVGYGHGERISEHTVKIKTLVGISISQLQVTVIVSITV